MRADNLTADPILPIWTALKLAVLWFALLILPFTERTLFGARTYYFLFIGLGCVFALYGLTIRTLFHFLQHTRREPIYVWIAFLFWSVLICSILALFAFEYDLLPHTLSSIAHRRPLIDYLYFEIMTFTTVGYGDIVPATAQGKFLAICTALLGATHGVTFVAIVLQALSHPPAKGHE
jgi:voltage-gated potassium channel Kch